MPPDDSSSSPLRSCDAPVNAPLACPNTSDSNSSSPSTAQLTGTNTARPRGPSSWIARASSSLPVPDSPSMTSGNLEAALPPSVTAADLGDCGSRASVLDRIVRQWNRTEARAAAKLTHTHAVVRREVAESVAHLAVLRGDDPIRTRASIRRRWRTA